MVGVTYAGDALSSASVTFPAAMMFLSYVALGLAVRTSVVWSYEKRP